MLCATRFWVAAGGLHPKPMPLTTPTIRRGARNVVRAQGFKSAEIDKAERELIRRGYLIKTGKGTIALTVKGAKVSRKACHRVTLAPWNWEASYRGRLDGIHRRRDRRR
jgi:hypothetical protein